jgi:hypothetical protein
VKNLPFDKPGRFYRGNLHTHTNRSDGMWSVEDVVAEYRDNGYDFLAITDHFLERYGFPITDTRALRTDRFTTILGAELHAPSLENGERWHIVAVGLPTDFAATGDAETGPQLANRAAEAGAFIGLAHPAWYGLTLKDAQSIEVAHAIEVYNDTCLWLNDRADGWYISDALSALGRRLTAYAADDAHFKPYMPDWRTAWVNVRAERLDPDALVAALKAGQYYASQGPEIADVRIEGDRMWVKSSPARAIWVTGVATRYGGALGDGMTEAEFSLERLRPGRYCRVTVLDAAGKRAWTNPIWLDGA